MLTPHRFTSRIAAALIALVGFAGAGNPAFAQGGAPLFQHEKYAAVVVDAANGEVLYARRADEPRYPASITKIMTLYLTFEAMAKGRLKAGDRVPVSAHAVSQAPSKLGVRAGDSLSVDDAIRAIAVKSANDVAVAMAERIGGTEAHFGEMMTQKAREIGMGHTRFANASGLPDPRQITTARDIAILSRAVMRDYPQYYGYFGIKSFMWRGHEITNHNQLLKRTEGVDGLKTGFTNAAGFNLAASAVRSGRRLITVVMGGSSTAARDENVEDLLNGGFEVLAKRAKGVNITLASTLHEPADSAGGPIQRPPTEMGSGEQQGMKIVVGETAPMTLATLPPSLAHDGASGPAAAPPGAGSAAAQGLVCVKAHGKGRHHHRALCYRPQDVAKAAACAPRRGKARARACAALAAAKTAKPLGHYQVQVGVFPTPKKARLELASLRVKYARLLTDQHRVEKAGQGKYRARFAGFGQDKARQACETLTAKGVRCIVIAGS
jgi:D-alanyl-D-alanine carboxypeptidase